MMSQALLKSFHLNKPFWFPPPLPPYHRRNGFGVSKQVVANRCAYEGAGDPDMNLKILKGKK
jgi:hypothetical protein